MDIVVLFNVTDNSWLTCMFNQYEAFFSSAGSISLPFNPNESSTITRAVDTHRNSGCPLHALSLGLNGSNMLPVEVENAFAACSKLVILTLAKLALHSNWMCYLTAKRDFLTTSPRLNIACDKTHVWTPNDRMCGHAVCIPIHQGFSTGGPRRHCRGSATWAYVDQFTIDLKNIYKFALIFHTFHI